MPKVWAWLRSYYLLERYPTLPQPERTLSDPQTQQALLMIAQEFDALEAKPEQPRG